MFVPYALRGFLAAFLGNFVRKINALLPHPGGTTDFFYNNENNKATAILQKRRKYATILNNVLRRFMKYYGNRNFRQH